MRLRKIFYFTVVALFFFLTTKSVSAEYIDSYKTDITVGSDGKIDIVETIRYNFEDNHRHGIYRSIPYVKTNRDGKQFKFDINDILVHNEEGKLYKYAKKIPAIAPTERSKLPLIRTIAWA